MNVKTIYALLLVLCAFLVSQSLYAFEYDADDPDGFEQHTEEPLDVDTLPPFLVNGNNPNTFDWNGYMEWIITEGIMNPPNPFADFDTYNDFWNWVADYQPGGDPLEGDWGGGAGDGGTGGGPIFGAGDGNNGDENNNGEIEDHTISGTPSGTKNLQGPFAAVPYQLSEDGLTGVTIRWQMPEDANGAILQRVTWTITTEDGASLTSYKTEAWPVMDGMVYKYLNQERYAGIDVLGIADGAPYPGAHVSVLSTFVDGFSIDESEWNGVSLNNGEPNGMYTADGFMGEQDSMFSNAIIREVDFSKSEDGHYYVDSYKINGTEQPKN
jgi:hypothetical protein